MAKFLTSIFGSRNQRLLRQYSNVVKKINALEEGVQALDDNALKAKTTEFRKRYADGETLEALLPEVFAIGREAAVRTLHMRPFDVQLIGGMVLHDGNIAEMRTGEGKTLMSTLPAYLNAISNDGVHIVTVNEYLAQRDADWMRPIYEFLGLTVGVSKSGQSQEEKRAAYLSDITYATNNELGFDYLRDNLAFSTEDKVQRKLNFAIVDEVDSILIDEARTPLIISGPAESSTDLYAQINKLIPKLKRQEETEEPSNYEITANQVTLVDSQGKTVTADGGDGEPSDAMTLEKAVAIAEERDADVVLVDGSKKVAACRLVSRGDFTVDEKAKQTYMTEEGHAKVEALMARAGLLAEGESLYDAGNIRLLHHLNSALRAHAIYQRDVDYIVKDGEVVIVDEFTGRTMPGRRWGDGLHQAVEAKEGVAIKQENQTVASITFQNYFRLYKNLSGMTGTADTEAFEFQQIYGLEVVVIPTHKPMIREDQPDLVYLTEKDKYEAIVADIVDCSERGQPALVGTTSIEASELLSSFLTKRKIKHEVLNAKQHEREAHIVQNAGRPGAITIATNMAGRGTDIVLGGSLDAALADAGDGDDEAKIRKDWDARHAQVIEAGGLHIVGTERHESRRIDNQLRGRSGRQGDPGSSRFYLSMEDTLMRIFGDPERTKNLLSRAGMREGEAIESRLLTRQIERAQRKVESHNFDIRKNLLEYDDVANDQRKVVYHQRSELMDADDISESVAAIRDEVVEQIVHQYIPPGSLDEMWDTEGLSQALESDFGLRVDASRWVSDDKTLSAEAICQRCIDEARSAYDAKVSEIGAELMRRVEKQVMLRQLDHHWKEHLAGMDHLRQGIGLRSYAQKNPKQEYKREAFEMFGVMLEQVKHDTISILSRIRIQGEDDLDEVAERKRAAAAMKFQHAEASVLGTQPSAQGGQPAAQPALPFVRDGRKIGRNEPCPCGSGKKFKQCHGKLN
ncbi:MAG: preprotein translocase subunit SecA [Gammaproteobacteria bacterium]|nr:preprotein translocase subunit SecA [Gammaproteobacteria bacterium]MDH3362469.1 preprotein translocase subunit SecA [Gammaproteobacteria bacterium]MDH3480484.1 preprotein translocase subunit SecA [Gammaproteobacteria bacterium]